MAVWYLDCELAEGYGGEPPPNLKPKALQRLAAERHTT
jgi:hypothetical protein